jgi:hypothetical protein
MSEYFDFNNAERQQSFDVIPSKTVAPVRMTIKPGGYDDPSIGLNGGYATLSDNSGSIFFNCEFTITGGKYSKRKVFTNIGLYSPKGPNWGNMGRSFMRAIIESARGVSSKDESPEAAQKRRINSYGDLDGVEFLAMIGIEKDSRSGDDKNVIKAAVTIDMKAHAAYVAGDSGGAGSTTSEPTTVSKPAWTSSGSAGGPGTTGKHEHAGGTSAKPAWAQ